VQSTNNSVILVPRALNDVVHRICEPVGELLARSKDVRHKKMKQRPKLHQTILERSTRKQKSPLGVEVNQRLPALALKVLEGPKTDELEHEARSDAITLRSRVSNLP
jgi:hypothetical protein